jgi:hypothetical protein
MAQGLTEERRRRVEELARQKGEWCQECQSADHLVSEDRASTGLGGFYRVFLGCDADGRCLTTGGAELKLAREVAKAIGLNVDPDNYPETQ